MTYLDFFPVPLDLPAAAATSLMCGLAQIGLAIAFFAGDPRGPATRALMMAQASIGLAVATNGAVALPYMAGSPMHWLLRVPVFECLAVLFIGLWTLSTARTAQTTPRVMASIKGCVWAFWFGTVVYAVLVWLYPVERVFELWGCLGTEQGCGTRGFRIFAVPLALMALSLTAAFVVLFSQRIDSAERERAVAATISVPFFFGIYIVPWGYNAYCSLLGALILSVGAIRYHGIRGERGVFMSRFLSPEVAKLVRNKGLDHTMQSQSLEITAVSCDLRGFTKLSLFLASDQVIRLLNEYYDAVGKVVAEFHGTIKDYAGDGVLILIGAPLPVADHARQGLAMAQRLRQVVADFIGHWAGPEMKLGFGVGVASGRVTVGAVGSASRMEYSAVGPAVNLAARLCAQAADGEILVDGRTAELAEDSTLQARAPLTLKGLGEVPHFASSPT